MKKETQKSPLKRGFTLVELLVVIVIVAALAAVVFTFASRMKKRGEVTKSLNAMRQVSVLSGIYSVENNDNLPPMQSEKENEDGSYTTLQWNLSILSLAYSDTEAERLKDVNWWKMNKPFMLSNLMINNINTPSFKPDKCGIGMNKWLQYNLIPNGGTDWILGKGGRQSLGVPKSKVARPLCHNS
jgi:prepilin-type N-terminal cleavage/methylation domain-containing protein